MPNVHLRKFLALIPLVLQQGCSDAPQMDGIPVDGVAQPSVTTPAPPTTGINPVTGWPGGLFGATAAYTHDLTTVSFHGGTWTVPIPVTPGQALSDVNFTIEAPTGTSGDPTSVRVGLYSNGNALAFANLTPFGLGARVNGNIPLNGRVIVSGEVLDLEFAALDANAGGYATNDTKIDTVGVTRPQRTRTKSFYPKIISQGAAGPWANTVDAFAFDGFIQSTTANSQAFIEVPSDEGDTLTGLSLEAEGTGAVNCQFILFYGVGMNEQLGVASLNDFARSTPWGRVEIGLTPVTVAPGAGFILYVQSSAAGYRIGKMHATFAIAN